MFCFCGVDGFYVVYFLAVFLCFAFLAVFAVFLVSAPLSARIMTLQSLLKPNSRPNIRQGLGLQGLGDRYRA